MTQAISNKKIILGLLLLGVNLLMGQISKPPVLSAEGDQIFCSLSEQNIVTDFSIEINDAVAIEKIYIQISSGYTLGEDILRLNGTHPKVTSGWNVAEAKLTLRNNSADDDLSHMIDAVKNVVFYSNNSNPTRDKYFSITIGSANYLPSTQHYYEFIPSLNISWTEAKTAAENKNYFGIKGYLVTILSQDEADISGKLTDGVGWIGGSDQESEGIWKWETGPEAGTVFWTGGINGSTTNYANWNTNEPNNSGNEDYAHITDPSIGFSGSWNDLPNITATSGPFQAKGYVVEYGGSEGDPELNITASSRLKMPKIVSITNSNACFGETQTLTVSTTNTEINWYDSITGGNMIHTETSFSVQPTSTITYWIDIFPADCPSATRTPITATVHQYPVILNKNLIVEQCDNDDINDGKTVFNLNTYKSIISSNSQEETFEFFTSPDYDMSSKILNPEDYTNTSFIEQLFVKINTPFNCSETSSLTLKVGASIIDSDFYMEFETCETETKTLDLGIENWEKTTFEKLKENLIDSNLKFESQNIQINFYSNETDAYLRQNNIQIDSEGDVYTMQTPYLQKIWARVDNLDLNTLSCLGIKEVAQLQVNKLPEFRRSDDLIITCINLDPVPIGVESIDGKVYSYSWTKNGLDYPLNIEGVDNQILISEGGFYEVTATTTDGKNCSKKIGITIISSEIATLTQKDLVVIDLVGDTGSIEILTDNLGVGSYEYAIDDPIGVYQDQPFFDNLLPGIHTIYIQDKNNCGRVDFEVSVLGHMKFFSPNGDGINDRWRILGVNENFQPKTRVYIYDRWGRLLVDLDPLDLGWDGTFNGSKLPQDDYWFRVFFENGKEYKGHFSLLRPQ